MNINMLWVSEEKKNMDKKMVKVNLAVSIQNIVASVCKVCLVDAG